jgi:hypothetical protein
VQPSLTDALTAVDTVWAGARRRRSSVGAAVLREPANDEQERVGAVTAPGPWTGSGRLHADLTILARFSCPLSRV